MASVSTAVIAIGTAALLALSSSGRTTPNGCQPAESDISKMVFGKVRTTLTHPRSAPVRDAMGLERLPEDSVILVTSDSLCQRAIHRIAEYRKSEPTGSRIVLVRIGLRYWAEDPSLRGGEWNDVYLLDAELSRVIARH